MKIKAPLIAALAFAVPTSFMLGGHHETAEKSDTAGEKSEPKKKKHKFKDVSVEELKAAIDSGKVTIIDANGLDKYKAGHIPGALSFHEVKEEMAGSLPEDKGALIVTYCGGPTWSAWKKAAVAAKKLGYTNVKSMTAGVSGWKDAGNALEKE